MRYRTLGRTGLSVSQLGFGAMRLPMTTENDRKIVDRAKAIPMIHRAFEAGVNYIDTAVGYCAQDSQRVVGEALKGWRDRVIVSTKNPDYGTDEKAWWTNLENSLERLQVSHIDVYNHHGISWKSYEEHVRPRLGPWMRRAKDQGLIRHVCCSFHDTAEALRKLIDTGYPDVLTLQYNLLDRSLADGIAHAHAQGIGVVVMGPVGGGRLGADTDALKAMVPGIGRVPELALRFVLQNPAVSIALSGMSTMEQVEENLAVASCDRAFSATELALIDEHMTRLRKLAELYCTGCGYCKPCPQKIDIPRVFGAYNQGRVYGFWPHARGAYRGYSKDPKVGQVSQCTACGQCEQKCPQKIPIVRQLKESDAALREPSV
jgi:uncharacterized protein